MDTYVNSVATYLFAQSWQIALFALIVGLISFALKNRSAHIRYLLWLIVLAKCLIPPIYSVPVPVLPDRSSVEMLPGPVLTEILVVDSRTTKADTHVEVQTVNASQNSKFALPNTKQTIILVWLLGVFLFLLWVGFRAVRYTLWLHSRRRSLPVHLKRKLQEPFDCLNFKKLPRIWLTKDIGQPFVWGLLRGSVYLPVDFTDLDCPQHNRTVIVHELSHIIRYDAAINLIQILAQAIFWFHPVVWWVNRKIRQEREKCCDEMVVAQFSTAPEHYTDAIVEALTAEQRSAHPVPSLAIVGSVKDIEERIKNMLRPGKKFYKRPSVIALIIILFFAFLIVPIGCVLTDKSETKTVTEQRENTPKSIFEAIWASDPDEVKRLIANGVDVNATNPDIPDVKHTPLMAAANGGFAEVAKVLLENGAEVNTTDFQGWTALYYAFWLYSSDDNEKKHRERAELVKALIASGADVNKKNQGTSPLINAITTGTPRLGSIEALLDAGADLHFKDNRGLTPLYYAAFEGDRDVLDLIIERGDYADTIHLAACRGDLDKVQTLLEKGADVNTKDEFGCTPLHWAARARSPEVAGLLIANGADINATAGPDNLTPFMAARKLPVIELLVSKGVDINSQENLSKLHDACSAGDIQVVRFLIDKGADINARNSQGSTPLCVAAASNHKEVVELLLDEGANINAPGRRGYTPLGIAARCGSKETAEFLIEKGANIHTPDNKGMTPLDLAKEWGWTEIVELLREHGAEESEINEQTIEMAINSNNLEKVKELIAQGADVNVRDSRGNTPLIQAIIQRKLLFVEILVSGGADVNAKDEDGQTPLHLAVLAGRKDIVELLIAKGADVNVKSNTWDTTPLIAALRSGHEDIAQMLIVKGADVNGRGRGDYTPLHCAAMNRAGMTGSIEIMKLLLAGGADIEARQEHDATPLACATYDGNTESTKFLIEHDANIEAKLNDGETTPLLRAVSQQYVETAKLLLDKRANIQATWRGLSAIHVAMLGSRLSNRKSDKEMVKLLIERGLESPPIHLAAFFGDLQKLKNCLKDGAKVDEQDAVEFTALHCAVCGDHMDIVKFLLDSGAKVNAKTFNGWTPLGFAWTIDMAALLIANGADVRIADERGQTALHWAVNRDNHRGDKALIELLLKHGADVNARAASTSGSWAGWTPLHVACRNGYPDIVELLLTHGADVNAKTDKDETPTAIAQSNKHRQVVELLMKHGAKE
jgi:serine/threonine-protein phosphatase 6 regulatory ankyrin repeat subunit B